MVPMDTEQAMGKQLKHSLQTILFANTKQFEKLPKKITHGRTDTQYISVLYEIKCDLK